MPTIADIDQMKIHWLAPITVILDLVGDFSDDFDFRWRYAGTRFCNLIDMDPTGRCQADVFVDEVAENAKSIYRTALENREGHAWNHWVANRHTDREFLRYDRLFLPIADRGGEPRHLIGVYDFEVDRKDD